MPTPTARKRKEKKAQVLSSDLLKMWPWGSIEYRFDPDRKWRFDWADPDHGFAVELDGYQYHTIRSRWLEDMEKMNEALIQGGWLVLHITPDQFRNGDAYLLLKRLYDSILGAGNFPGDVIHESKSD